MPKWMRIGLGLLAGIFAGGLSLAVTEKLGHSIVKGDAIFIVAALGLGIASFLGGLISAWIGKANQLPWIIAIVLGGLSLINVFSFKHPTWFVPAGFILLAIGAWLASRLHKAKVAKP